MDRVVCLILLMLTCLTSARDIKIGFILPGGYGLEELVDTAVAYVNNHSFAGPGKTITYLANYTNCSNCELNFLRIACEQLSSGVMALLGPLTSTDVKVVVQVSSRYHVPLLAPVATDPTLGSGPEQKYLVRMSPSDDMQGQALIDVIDKFRWQRMALLTSNSDYGVYGMVKFQTLAADKGWHIASLVQFTTQNGSHVDAKEQLVAIKNQGIRVIILNCLAIYAQDVFRQAHDLNMTSTGWVWLSTDSISSTTLLSAPPIADYLQGVVSTRMRSTSGALYLDFLEYMNDNGLSKRPFTTVDGKIVDSILAVAYASEAMFSNPANGAVVGAPIDCDNPNQDIWTDGQIFTNYIQKVDKDGVSSRIKFRPDISIYDTAYDVVNLVANGWKEVATWDTDHGLVELDAVHFHGNVSTAVDYVSDLASRHFRIATLEELPFVIFSANITDMQNIDKSQITGYTVDVVNKLSSDLGFGYSFMTPRDDAWGSKDPGTGRWNGMIREILDGGADMIGTAFTITRAREEAVDFTAPYIDLGMQIMMKKEPLPVIDTFKFLRPYSMEVYIAILVCHAVMALVISLLNKLSPYGHHGRFAQDEHPEERFENMQLGRSVDESGREQPYGIRKLPARPDQTTMADVYARMKHQQQKEYITYKREKRKAISKLDIPNAIWFSAASLLQQGGEYYPRALSARITTVLWWMAIMVFVATYTANMAAFLTADRLTTTIESIEDLGHQTTVYYGTTDKSAPSAYFRDSPIALYREMYTFMKDTGGLSANSALAVAKVRKSTNPEFAFISDSLAVQYEALRAPCDVHAVGQIFAKIGYGLALPQHSRYAGELSKAILDLRENGFMDYLMKKWFTNRGECSVGVRDTAVKPTDYRIGILQLLGVFYIIACGVLISFLILIVEWLVFSYGESKKYGGKRTFESLKESFVDKVWHLNVDIKRDWFPRLPYCIRPQWQQTTQVAPLEQGPGVGRRRLSVSPERKIREWRHVAKAPRNADISLDFSDAVSPSNESRVKIRQMVTHGNEQSCVDTLSFIQSRNRAPVTSFVMQIDDTGNGNALPSIFVPGPFNSTFVEIDQRPNNAIPSIFVPGPFNSTFIEIDQRPNNSLDFYV